MSYVIDTNTLASYISYNDFNIDLIYLYKEMINLLNDVNYLKSYLFTIPKHVISYDNSTDLVVCRVERIDPLSKTVYIHFFTNIDTNSYLNSHLTVDDFLRYQEQY